LQCYCPGYFRSAGKFCVLNSLVRLKKTRSTWESLPGALHIGRTSTMLVEKSPNSGFTLYSTRGSQASQAGTTRAARISKLMLPYAFGLPVRNLFLAQTRESNCWPSASSCTPLLLGYTHDASSPLVLFRNTYTPHYYGINYMVFL
jgi:hypothetical protein